MGYKETDVVEFLRKLKDENEDREIIYVPNPGNAGDSLIAYGTLQIFKKIGLKYTMGFLWQKYDNKLIIYGGGGNLVGIYKACHNFIQKHKKNNQIVMLPSTVNDEDELLMSLEDNVQIFCREKVSYDYVRKMMKNPDNVFLAHDMAFYIELGDEYFRKGKGTKFCFRTDRESKQTDIPLGNIDYSSTLKTPNNTGNVREITNVSLSVCKALSEYSVIATDRLHLAIAGCLVKIKVNFYPGTYFKNKAVYEHSIKDKYPGITFFD